MVKVTTEEYNILKREVPPACEFLGRDGSDELWGFQRLPHKSESGVIWVETEGFMYLVTPFDRMFEYIKWDDAEPWSVTDLLHLFEEQNDEEEVKAINPIYYEFLKPVEEVEEDDNK